DGLYLDPDDVETEKISQYAGFMQEQEVEVCQTAVHRMEAARIVWVQSEVDLAVNRRERVGAEVGQAVVLGWNPDELVDNQVTVLQARRLDETVIATLVNYGCHPIT